MMMTNVVLSLQRRVPRMRRGWGRLGEDTRVEDKAMERRIRGKRSLKRERW